MTYTNPTDYPVGFLSFLGGRMDYMLYRVSAVVNW